MRELDKYKGYTVDFRLHEFRKMIYGRRCEFISFNSPKGRKLLDGYLKGGNELDMK